MMRTILSTTILLLSHLLLVSAQQYGSFFTAIYINVSPSPILSSGQVSCNGMGYPAYCCPAGQYCAPDAAGHVACCAQGWSCQGYAGSNGGYTSGYNNGQYYTSSTWQARTSYVQVTSTVIVQATQATQQAVGGVGQFVVTTTTTTTEAVAIVSTISTTTTTTQAAAAGNVATNTCNGGVSVLTAQGGGLPITQTRGCDTLIIVNAGRSGGRVGFDQALRSAYCAALALWALYA